MPVKDADPRAQELTAAFGAAMDAPAKPRGPETPPERDDDAPHGRDDQGQPLAPYGYTRDGKVKKSAAGRKRNPDEDARTAKPGDPGTAAAAAAELPAHDFTGDLGEFADSVWLALTFGSQLPLERVPLIGKLPIGKHRRLSDVLKGAEVRLAAQAYLLNVHKGGLVAGLNVAAQHNHHARRWAEKLEGGGATWVVTVGALAGPFLLQSRAMWTGETATLGVDVAELAERNRQQFAHWQAGVLAMLEQQAQLEMASADATADGQPAPVAGGGAHAAPGAPDTGGPAAAAAAA